VSDPKKIGFAAAVREAASEATAPKNPGFVEAVRKQALLPERDLERALGADRNAFRLLRHLLTTGLLSRRDGIRIWAEGYGHTGIDILDTLVDRSVLLGLPRQFAEAHQIMLVYKLGNRVTAAVADPTNRALLGEAERLARTPLSIVTALPDELAEAIRLHYPADEDLAQLESQAQNRVASRDDSEKSLREEAQASEIVQLVDTMLGLAIKEHASDVHVEPRETQVQVRFRIDGGLRDRVTLSSEIFQRVISRMKLMAGMNITERRMPQDGRITLALPTGPVDFRASTVPTRYGEKMVLRSLAKGGASSIPDLDKLDFDADNLAALRRLVESDSGILLATGPTGSGKTTALFAMLKAVDGTTLNIVTAEEPIEYVLPRATQVAVNRPIGLGFAQILRAFMRQDPDVILLGEIRDQETGQVATEAAQTGHLVLASLHANSALEAMTRMLQLGIEGYMLGPALRGVLSQRLVRRICTSCRVAYKPPRELLERYFEFEGDPDVPFYRGAGCKECGETGFRGRIGIHELAVPNMEVRGLLIDGAPLTSIGDAARRAGFRPLIYDGLKKVLRGLTTIEEVAGLARD
jgi:type IV pilus assembly protein PilB